MLSLTAGNTPFVLDVRRGLPSESATELNRKGLMLPSSSQTHSLFSFLFVCKQPSCKRVVPGNLTFKGIIMCRVNVLC